MSGGVDADRTLIRQTPHGQDHAGTELMSCLRGDPWQIVGDPPSLTGGGGTFAERHASRHHVLCRTYVAGPDHAHYSRCVFECLAIGTRISGLKGGKGT